AALMKIRNIFIYTHDSIGVGEDGPTHQPVEQIPSLRIIPDMHVWRPCDAVESVVAWKNAIERNDGPSSLLFSRQTVEHQQRNPLQIKQINQGAYVLKDCGASIDAIIIATGSEVGIAMQAAKQLELDGKNIRVVSMPCAEVYEQQSDSYKHSVLPANVITRVAVEAAQGDYWHKYVGLNGKIISQDTFGESAPGNVLFEHFGFNSDNVVDAVKSLMS
ncbi:MAG: transketolase, partial [Proteobacteria bacterium]|nr:transketolase [Pseudomonadota bacterium]